MDFKVNGRKRKNVDKPICKYGASCYRKNPEHRKKFKHLPKQDKEEEKNSLSDSAVEINTESEADSPEKNEKVDSPEKNEEVDSPEKNDEADSPEKNEEVDSPEKNDEADSLEENDEADSSEKNDETDSSVKNDEADSSKDANLDSSVNILKEVDDVRIEETVGEILKSMPKDFSDFWKFCSSVSKSKPQDVFSHIGYRLVGIYDLLAKRLPADVKVDISCHYRYFYDPPEFQTVIVKDGKDLYHIGYFRDDPSEMPSILASNSAALGEKLTLMGDNIFCAMNAELTKVSKKSSASENTKSKVRKLQKSLLDFASQKKYSLEVQSSKTKQRQKKVVAKTFHGLGIVVPIKNDVGYRPLPRTNAGLKNILRKIVSAENEEKRLEEEEFLDEIITNVQFANDECDFGMGLELGIDIFCYGDPYFHRTVERILSLAYKLLKYPKYALIIKKHLKKRKKGEVLRTIDV